MDPATHAQRKASRPDPEDVARIVNARMAAGRTLARYRETAPASEARDVERDIERIVAVLADFAERLHSAELLADYAAERAESNDGG